MSRDYYSPGLSAGLAEASRDGFAVAFQVQGGVLACQVTGPKTYVRGVGATPDEAWRSARQRWGKDVTPVPLYVVIGRDGKTPHVSRHDRRSMWPYEEAVNIASAIGSPNSWIIPARLAQPATEEESTS